MPLAFTPGRTGRLFVEFALALAGAVVVSGVVALTLTPMLCTLLLKHNPKSNRFDSTMERVLTGISDRFGALLRWTVTARFCATGRCDRCGSALQVPRAAGALAGAGGAV
ncbi:RND multidrug efflux transporter; Acriflavin resistance protein [Polaromonas sp. CG9_12]|nr:RND multidrug efflux transporter; Acriflavin resistance protein [Polaromonas sp. CG9_12]